MYLVFQKQLKTKRFRRILPARNRCVSGRRSIRHLWGCLRDWIRLRWPNLVSCLMLSLQKRSKTDRSLERPPKRRRVRGPKRTCSGRAECVENVLFSTVSEKRDTPRIGKSENFQIVGRSKSAQVRADAQTNIELTAQLNIASTTESYAELI